MLTDTRFSGGRYALKTGDPIKLSNWIKEYTYTKAESKGKSAEELEGKLECGQFVKVEREIYAGTSRKEEER